MAKYKDAEEAALDPENIRRISSGTIELEFVGDRPTYRVGGRVFGDLKEAVTYRKTAGISVVHTFVPDMPLSGYATNAAGVASGDQNFTQMMEYATKTRHKIHLHNIKFDEITDRQKALDQFTDESGNVMGYLSASSKGATFEQWEDINNPGKFLTTEQIVKQQEKYGTVEWLSDGKVGSAAKRHKADVRAATYDVQLDRRLTVGIFDPQEFLRTTVPGMEDITHAAAAMSHDGAGLMNPKVIREILSLKEKEKRQLLLDLEKLPKGSLKYRNLQSVITKQSSKISELKGIALHGGLFNWRADVFDVALSSHYSGSTAAKELDDLYGTMGQPKGNLHVVPEGTDKAGVGWWDRAVASRAGTNGFKRKGGGALAASDVDVLLTSASIATNKTEARQGVKNSSRIMLDARELLDNTWLNTQQWTAHPDLFDQRRLQRFTLDQFQEQAQTFADTGKLPEGMERSFRSAIAGGDDILGASRASVQQAKAVIDLIESGVDVRSNPHVVSTVLNSMVDFFSDGKGADKSRLLLPDTVSHEVTNFQNWKDATAHEKTRLLPGHEQLPEGHITYSKTGGFAMNELDIQKYGPAFGGFDLDDRLINSARYDEVNKRFVTAATRDPTTAHEIGSFIFDPEDELSQQILIRKNKEWNFLDQIRGHERGVENQLKHYDKIASAKIAGVDIGTATQVSYAQAYNERSEAKMAEILEKNAEAIKSQMVAIKSASHRIDTGNYILGDEYDEVENLRGLHDHMDVLQDTRHSLLTMPELDLLLDDKYMDPAEIQLSGNARAQEILEETRVLKQQVSEDFERRMQPRLRGMLDEHVEKLIETLPHVGPGFKESVDAQSRAYGKLNPLFKLIAKDEEEISKVKAVKSTMTSSAQKKAFLEAVQAGQHNELGRYSNVKMIVDNVLHENKGTLSTILGHVGDEFFEIPELEDVIDTQVKEVGGVLTADEAISRDLQQKLGRMAAILDVEGGPKLRLDKELMRERGVGESLSTMRESYMAHIKASKVKGDFKFEDSLVEGEYSKLVKGQKSTLDSIKSMAKSITSKVKYDDFYSTHTFSKDALDDAEFLIRAYDHSKEVREGAGPQFKAIKESFEDYGTDLLTDGLGREEYSKKAAKSLVADDMFAAMGRIAERRGGHENVYEAVGALQQMYNDSPRKPAAKSARSILSGRGESGAMLDIINRTNAHFGIGNAAPRDLDIAGLPKAPKHILESEAAFYGEKQLASSTIGTKASKGLLSLSEGFAKLKQVPGVKAAAAIGLATVVGSFMYQHRKDHTPEDMSGPPLLPGGSAYETMPVESMPTRTSGYQQASEGDTYNVYASGSFDQQEFSDSIGAATGGAPSSVSVYNTRKLRHQGSMDAYVGRNF